MHTTSLKLDMAERQKRLQNFLLIGGGILLLIFIYAIFRSIQESRVVYSENYAAMQGSSATNANTFYDDFNNAQRSGWNDIDEGTNKTPSNWVIGNSGILRQTSKINSGYANRTGVAAQGTYTVFGNNDWANYDYSIRMKSTDNSAMGVIFRHKNQNNYYRFSMDNQGNYRRLVKKVNGQYQVIAQVNQGYSLGQWYEVRVTVSGSNIKVYLDNVLAFDINDTSISSGKVGAYTFSGPASFDDVKVDVSATNFTLAVIPDTQYYTYAYPNIFTKQTQWIAQNRAKEGITFVLHEGDVTQENSTTEWARAKASMKFLDGKTQYTIIPGNHDYYGPNRGRLFDETFPVSKFSNQPTFGGVQKPDTYRNSYSLFSSSGTDWLVMSLGFAPTDQDLSWANTIVAHHPNRRVIVLTHAYLAGDNTLLGSKSSHTDVPKPPKNDGVGIWNKLVKLQPNIQFVMNGHVVSPDGTGRLISTGNNGNKIYQMLANYQGFGANPGQMGVNGGNGYLRLLKFFPAEDKVEVKTYSPSLDRYLTDPENQFTLTGVQL